MLSVQNKMIDIKTAAPEIFLFRDLRTRDDEPG